MLILKGNKIRESLNFIAMEQSQLIKGNARVDGQIDIESYTDFILQQIGIMPVDWVPQRETANEEYSEYLS